MSLEQKRIPGVSGANPEQPRISRWRSLIRVVNVEETEEGKKIVRVVVPGWDSTTEVTFPLEIVPEDLREKLLPDFRFHAMVNLAAEVDADLCPDTFETSLPLDPEDRLE
jgi:hypothetical protein